MKLSYSGLITCVFFLNVSFATTQLPVLTILDSVSVKGQGLVCSSFCRGDSLLVSVSKGRSVFVYNGQDVADTFRYNIRDLYFDCTHPDYCLTQQRDSGWAERGALRIYPFGNCISGLNVQNTDLNIFSEDFTKQKIYAFGFPFHAGKFIAYHNYFSKAPVQFCDGRGFILLRYIKRRDHTRFPGRLPAFAYFDIQNFVPEERLEKPVVSDSVRIRGYFGRKKFQRQYRAFSGLDYYESFVIDTSRKKIYYSAGGEKGICEFDLNGKPIRCFGKAGYEFKHEISVPRRLAKQLDSVQTAYCHILASTQLYSLQLSADASLLFILKKEPISEDSVYSYALNGQLKNNRDFDSADACRNVTLLVFDTESHRFLREYSLPFPPSILGIGGVNSKNQLWIWREFRRNDEWVCLLENPLRVSK